MRFTGTRIRKILLGICLVSGISSAATPVTQEITSKKRLSRPQHPIFPYHLQRKPIGEHGWNTQLLDDACVSALPGPAISHMPTTLGAVCLLNKCCHC